MKSQNIQAVVSCFVKGRSLVRLSAWTQAALSAKFNLSPAATFTWAKDASSVVIVDGDLDIQVTAV